MMLTRIWKKGTASIIIEPFPPGKILPPNEKTNCDMMQLEVSKAQFNQTHDMKNIETPREPKP
jgi:hypothetical protein